MHDQNVFHLAVYVGALACVLVMTDWCVVRRLVAQHAKCECYKEIHQGMLDKFYITYLLAISAADAIMLLHDMYDFATLLGIVIIFVEGTFIKSKL